MLLFMVGFDFMPCALNRLLMRGPRRRSNQAAHLEAASQEACLVASLASGVACLEAWAVSLEEWVVCLGEWVVSLEEWVMVCLEEWVVVCLEEWVEVCLVWEVE